jgi:serine phosphatase RsbU (regulator of sigma subunit)
MSGRELQKRRPLSLIWYLIGFITLIVGIVVISALAFSFVAAGQEIRQDFSILENNAANNAEESVWLVNTGLFLIDEDLNPPLNRSLHRFRDAYVEAGSDPSRMNLSAVRDAIAPSFAGTVNLYIIDADGIIRYTTLEEVRGIDFRQYPSFYERLTETRLGNTFAADPVVRSIPDVNDPAVRGTLRKFAYLPAPDHRYVLEVGVDSDAFSDVRSRFSYQEMVDRLIAVNPDIVGIRVWDIYGIVGASAGTPGVNGWESAQQAFDERKSLAVTDPANRTETRFVFVNLRDPNAVSDSSVVVEIRFSTGRLDNALAGLVAQYAGIGFVAVLVGIILAFVMFRKLTGAIGAIVEDVGIVAGGDLSHEIRSVETAEFAELESGINTMIRKILLYSEELERKKAELLVAAEIQQAFLPKDLPAIPGFSVAAVNYPAREVGGDFYDIFPVANGNHAIVVADVSGKGVPASLFMALSRTAVRIVSRWERSARRVLEGSNTIFLEDAGSTSFVTLFYAILRPRERTITYVNAGHNPPLLFHPSGEIEELGPTGPVIGLVDDPGYAEEEAGLGPGDVLVLYTDGITEAINNREEMFGDERLKRVVMRAAGLPVAGIVAAIRDAVTAFCGDVPQFDDMTLVVIKAE